MLLLYGSSTDLYKETVAYDKGKPAARWGRKAVSLSSKELGFQAFHLREIVWLPKAIGKSRDFKTLQC